MKKGGLSRTFLKSAGFTIIEVTVAIFIITAGVVGVLSLISQTVGSATISSQRLTAAYLAQEGIEIVRNIRDSNWLEQRWSEDDPPQPFWDDGLGGCGPAPAGCEADYKVDTLQEDVPLTSCPFPCDYDDLNFLNIDGDGFYSYSTGTPTKFKRKITITPSGGDILQVSVSVRWEEKGRTHEIEVREHLYNWRY